jgi:hypothetical protein
MNYGELQQAVIDYMHRADLEAQMPLFIQLAHSRIMRDCRVPAMMNDETLTMDSNPKALPDGFLAMRELSAGVSNRRYALKSVSPAHLSRAVGFVGSNPSLYSIIGNTVEVQPATTEDLRIVYFAALPFFADDAATNDILELYPYLYLYGALIEANSFIQDAEQRVKAIEFYQTEVAEVNADATNTRHGEAPTIGAA